MKEKKSIIKFIRLSDVEPKKGWSLGLGRKMKTKKLGTIISDHLVKKMEKR